MTTIEDRIAEAAQVVPSPQQLAWPAPGAQAASAEPLPHRLGTRIVPRR